MTQEMTDTEALDRFLKEEAASYDVIALKRSYVDMAGDLYAGVLLSQLVYHYLPDRQGCWKPHTVEAEGRVWVAIKRADWWRECRLDPDRFDRACRRLAEKCLIEARRFQQPGSDAPIKHLAINWERFMEARAEALETMPAAPRSLAGKHFVRKEPNEG